MQNFIESVRYVTVKVTIKHPDDSDADDIIDECDYRLQPDPDVDHAFATFDNAFSVSPRNHGYKKSNNFNVLFLAKSMGELNGIFFQKMSLLVEGRFEIEEFF